MKRLFEQALAEMQGNEFLAPRPFVPYARSQGFPEVKTADCISVQNYQMLAQELKEANTMVFRLGYESGSQASFALAKHTGTWADYFLIDDLIFKDCKILTAVIRQESLRIFDFLPRATETSLVNLAAASGLLQQALQLDDEKNPLVCATAQGAYNFEVRPHHNLAAVWNHKRGQVEIDGAFIAKQGGQETLFVVEAKVSSKFSSLSKHKVAYPMLAIEGETDFSKTEPTMPVVGVYLRVIREQSRFEFYVAECRFSSVQREIASLAAHPIGAYFIEKG